MKINKHLKQTKYIYILILISTSFFTTCKTYDASSGIKKKILRGQIIDVEHGDPLENSIINELYKSSNDTYIDFNGEFELEIQGKYPIIALERYGEPPLYFKLEFDTFNKIEINKNSEKASRKVYKTFLRSRKKEYEKFKDFSLSGDWVVTEKIYHKSIDWREPPKRRRAESLIKKWNREFPGGLRKNYKIKIEENKFFTINNERTFSINRTPEHLAFNSVKRPRKKWEIRYRYHILNKNTIIMLKDMGTIEIEWTLKRKAGST